MENIKKMTPDEEAGRINLQSYWKIFWRKKYYFLVPLVLSAVIAAVGVRRLTPIYESHTMLAIEDKNILSPTMERYVPASEDRSQMRNQQFRAMIETRVTSNDFLRLIVVEIEIHWVKWCGDSGHLLFEMRPETKKREDPGD